LTKQKYEWTSRGLIATHVAEFKEWRKSSETAGKEYDLYLDQHFLAIQEVSMWLGWDGSLPGSKKYRKTLLNWS